MLTGLVVLSETILCRFVPKGGGEDACVSLSEKHIQL